MKSTIRTIAGAVPVVLVLVVLLAPGRALAAVPVRVLVTRAADAASCPDAPGLAAAIGRAGNRPSPSVTRDAEARLRFDVDWRRSPSGYVARVMIMGARIGVREIAHDGPDCRPLAEALAVSLVLIIDDVEQSDASQPAPRAPPHTSPPSPDASSSPPSSPAPSSEPEASAGSATSTSPGTPPETSTSQASALGSPETGEARPRKRRVAEDAPDAVADDDDDARANNSFFLELGGNGLFWTLDYERIFGRSNFSLRVGFGFVHLTSKLLGFSFNEEDISVPFVASYYVGGGTHRLQLGAGALILDREPEEDGTVAPGPGLFGTQNGAEVYGTLLVGYRYLPPDGGLNFGVAFTPCFRPDFGFLWWGGANVGIGF